MISSSPERLPVYVLAGFLGSGKTTLLRQILAKPQFSDSAVIINELGEVALDHELIAFSNDSIVVLQGGCVCCGIRSDIEKALRELFKARDAGTIPPFRRLIIETTGIANPQPLIFTLHVNPLARARLMNPRVITVIDGVLGKETLACHEEATAQVVAADQMLVSKRDLSSSDTLFEEIRRLNPWAPVTHANLLADDLDTLFAQTPVAEERRSPCSGGFPEPTTIHANTASAANTANAHHEVLAFSLRLEQPLDWTGFGIWMTMLLHRHGPRVLRVKALLEIEGRDGPVAFHCAQHLVHPPEHLERWPGTDRGSKIVFVVRELDPQLIERSLKLFDAAARQASNPSGTPGYLAAGAGGSVAGRPIRRPTAPRWMKG